MGVRAFPFEGQEDANEEDYYLLHRECGVMAGLNLTLTGLNWSLSPGEVMSSGAMVVVEDAPASGASSATAGGQPRRDMLVARRVLLPGGGSYGEIALKQGAPAASPTDPELTRQLLGTFEEPLFSWQVAANGVASTSQVRNLRRPLRLVPGDRSLLLSQTGIQLPSNSLSWPRVTGWTVDQTSPLLQLSNGVITFVRGGVYAVKAYCTSDHNSEGVSEIRLHLPHYPGMHQYVPNKTPRSFGYPAAGQLAQSVAWSGAVAAGDTVAVELHQYARNGAAVTYGVHCAVEYLS